MYLVMQHIGMHHTHCEPGKCWIFTPRGAFGFSRSASPVSGILWKSSQKSREHVVTHRQLVIFENW